MDCSVVAADCDRGAGSGDAGWGIGCREEGGLFAAVGGEDLDAFVRGDYGFRVGSDADTAGLALGRGLGTGECLRGDVDGAESIVPSDAGDLTVGFGEVGDVVCVGVAVDCFGGGGGNVPGADAAFGAAGPQGLG